MRSKLFKPGWRWSDVLANFTDEQLKWLGAVAMAYNDAETWFYRMAEGVIYYPADLHEILSRLNGTEAIPPIVVAAVKRYDLPPATLKTIELALAAFGELKIARDLVVHARIHDKETAYAVRPGRKGKRDYTTLEANALQLLAQHLNALTAELMALRTVVGSKTLLFYGREENDHHREQLEKGVQAAAAHAKSLQTTRLALPRLPVLEQARDEQPSKGGRRRQKPMLLD